jgi:hypothetical protein
MSQQRWLAVAAAVLIVLLVGTSAYLIWHQRGGHRSTGPAPSPASGGWTAASTGGLGQITSLGAFQFISLGGPVLYVPPRAAPIPITWQTYQNDRDGYRLDSAVNWLTVNQPVAGHADWLVCPPGTDLQTPSPGPPPCVNFGWVSQFALPSATDSTVGERTAVTRDGVTGTLFTQTALGASITVVFPTHGGDLVLTADADTDAVMYAFQHMLASIQFQ